MRLLFGGLFLMLLTPVAVPAAAGDAAPAGAEGDLRDVTAACLSPEPYAEFEVVYESEGNFAAYKALMATEQCSTLPEAIEVELQKPVDSFDYGWGQGKVWRVSPVDPNALAPEAFYIRIRE